MPTFVIPHPFNASRAYAAAKQLEGVRPAKKNGSQREYQPGSNYSHVIALNIVARGEACAFNPFNTSTCMPTSALGVQRTVVQRDRCQGLAAH